MSDLYNVTSSPHVRSKMSTDKIMLCVIIALLPATVFGIYNFGPRALAVIVVTIASCFVSEFLYNKIAHKKQTVGDLSCIVNRSAACAESVQHDSLLDRNCRRSVCYCCS